MPIEAVDMSSNWSHRSPGGAMGSSPRQVLCGIAFWCAIGLPLGYVPLLALGEVSVGQASAMIALNIACLVVGHRHEPDGRVWSQSWDRLVAGVSGQ
ncbi:hypothetical protein Hrd1104_08350 [Halorhabdus sp. CBA1104]|nr:hypothetical protein Hrd1104_08350 [Halorhabdus sp. CBA1104]